MKLLLHTLLISGMLVGSDMSLNGGAETRTLLNKGPAQSTMTSAHRGARHISASLARFVGSLVD